MNCGEYLYLLGYTCGRAQLIAVCDMTDKTPRLSLANRQCYRPHVACPNLLGNEEALFR